MEKIKVTVGIPYYHGPLALSELIAALYKQKARVLDIKNEVEIIVVNDDDSDYIPKDLVRWSNIIHTIVVDKKNGGVASARNEIIRRARGEFIFFLDQDCVPEETWLEEMYMYLVVGDSAGAGGRIYPKRRSGIVNEYYSITNRLERPVVDRVTGDIVLIITANCGFRTEAIRRIGGFDEVAFFKQQGGEDADLTFRLKHAGYRLGFACNARVSHLYPNNFFSLFEKYRGYGRGMKIYCIVRDIDPESIRQPRYGILSFFWYTVKLPIPFFTSYRKFKKVVGFQKSIVFAFFETVKYVAHGIGFFPPLLVKKK